MTDEEIRIACVNAVVAWTGSANKMQDAQMFYDWVLAGRPKQTPTAPVAPMPKKTK